MEASFVVKALLNSTFTLERKHISYISPILQEQWEKFEPTTNVPGTEVMCESESAQLVENDVQTGPSPIWALFQEACRTS